MAEKPAAERTEQPTARRLRKARDQGQSPQSQDLGSAVTVMVLVLTVALMAPQLLRWFQQKLEMGLSGDVTAFADAQAFVHFANARIIDSALIMLPILAALFVAGIGAGIAVAGANFTPGALQIKWNAINPASVVQSLFNLRSFVRLLLSFVKLVLVGAVAWYYLQSQLEALAALRWAWSAQIVAAIAKIVFGLCVRVGLAVAILGIADAFYQKWQHIQDLKMTRQEVKQEHKDTEGSPELKSRIRRVQVEMSMKRLAQEVPKASVILVNPTHVAVALRYETRTMEAPMLLAKGADHLAERIVKIARSYGVPIIRRPDLARAIYADVKPGQPIPESLYVAVAEVLAMLYRLRQKKRAPIP
jgi:flagellar biosynthetic protein FlhB